MVNHQRSAGALEVVDAKIIFYRSIKKLGLCYVKFLPDGDSKNFPAVKNIYKGIRAEKTRIY